MKRTDLPRPLLYVLAFLLPALALTAAYAAVGMYPFGDKSILVSDMSSQYVEFFCALKHGDVFFSWSKALGTSYIGVFSYYVSSPLSLLTLLVPNQMMPLGLMGLTILKVGLAGLTWSAFAGRFFRRWDLSLPLFSLCYALCSYAVVYSMCIMWLDGMIWLPVILLGLEQILAGGKPWLFGGSLVVCFVSTWYISYMIGGFCCLWLVFRWVSLGVSRPALLGQLRTFLLSAAFALALTAWLWLPSFLAMFNGKLNDATADYTSRFNFSLPDLLGQLLPGQYETITNSSLPFLFCSTLVWVLALAFLFARPIPRRERLAGLGLVAVLVLSLWLAPLDKVWHLFKLPNWFPYRYSFLLSFVLILLAARVLPCLTALVRPRALARGVCLVAAVATCLEVAWNARPILTGIDDQMGYPSYSSYVSYYHDNALLVSAAREDAGEDAFCRVGATRDRGFNSPLSFGYPGITHYSSVYNKEVNALLKSLGFAQAWMWTAYYGSTPLTDGLLGIRYVISSGELPGGRAVANTPGLTLWETSASLPLAFQPLGEAPEGLPEESDPFQAQNNLLSSLLGEEAPVFTSVVPTVEVGQDAVALTFEGDGSPIYGDLSSSLLASLAVDGTVTSALGTNETMRIHYLGAPAPGDTLTVTITLRQAAGADLDWSSLFYRCDLALVEEGLAKLDNLQAVQVSSSSVTVEVGEEVSSTLATTIPAEDGWTAYVDGQRVDTGTWLGAFLSVDLPQGAQVVELRYTAPGLIPGLGLGVAALAALGIWLLLSRRHRT